MSTLTLKDARAPFALLSEQNAALFSELATPCYVIDERALIRNCDILASLAKNTGAKILLAQKAFSNYDFYPLLSNYLAGTEASGLYEARLGAEQMKGKETHVFCAAYGEKEFDEILKYADHIVFNSPAELKRFGPAAKSAKKSVGLRINPECSTQKSAHAIYDPCAVGSRLGVTLKNWREQMSESEVRLLDGLHFHTLCEQDSIDLEITLRAVEEKFGFVLSDMKWLNMGGGHHITRPGYDIKRLENCITRVKERYNAEVYLEPGEAVALNAGYLLSRVRDIVKNGGYDTAILDTSAACHMPDVLEMPYTPPLYGACEEKPAFVYRLAGPTCLAGDVIGTYGFDRELRRDSLLIFGDMAIYTTCKNNTFNGMPLPDIWRLGENGALFRLTSFSYEDFKSRLGRRDTI